MDRYHPLARICSMEALRFYAGPVSKTSFNNRNFSDNLPMYGFVSSSRTGTGITRISEYTIRCVIPHVAVGAGAA